MNVRRPIPSITLSETPKRGPDEERVARSIRNYADGLKAQGVILIASHTNRPGDPSVVTIETDINQPGYFALAERVAEMLRGAGLAAEFGWRWPRATDAWTALRSLHSGSSYPVLHVSVPARFGGDLTVLAWTALQPLRDEGVLLVGMSSVLRDAGQHQEPAVEDVEGAPV